MDNEKLPEIKGYYRSGLVERDYNGEEIDMESILQDFGAVEEEEPFDSPSDVAKKFQLKRKPEKKKKRGFFSKFVGAVKNIATLDFIEIEEETKNKKQPSNKDRIEKISKSEVEVPTLSESSVSDTQENNLPTFEDIGSMYQSTTGKNSIGTSFATPRINSPLREHLKPEIKENEPTKEVEEDVFCFEYNPKMKNDDNVDPIEPNQEVEDDLENFSHEVLIRPGKIPTPNIGIIKEIEVIEEKKNIEKFNSKRKMEESNKVESTVKLRMAQETSDMVEEAKENLLLELEKPKKKKKFRLFRRLREAFRVSGADDCESEVQRIADDFRNNH